MGEKIKLSEFCAGKSSEVTQVELLAAFEHFAKQKGVLKATKAQFNKLFADFVKMPA